MAWYPILSTGWAAHVKPATFLPLPSWHLLARHRKSSSVSAHLSRPAVHTWLRTYASQADHWEWSAWCVSAQQIKHMAKCGDGLADLCIRNGFCETLCKAHVLVHGQKQYFATQTILRLQQKYAMQDLPASMFLYSIRTFLCLLQKCSSPWLVAVPACQPSRRNDNGRNQWWSQCSWSCFCWLCQIHLVAFTWWKYAGTATLYWNDNSCSQSAGLLYLFCATFCIVQFSSKCAHLLLHHQQDLLRRKHVLLQNGFMAKAWTIVPCQESGEKTRTIAFKGKTQQQTTSRIEPVNIKKRWLAVTCLL